MTSDVAASLAAGAAQAAKAVATLSTAEKNTVLQAVSYTHLTLPTNREV